MIIDCQFVIASKHSMDASVSFCVGYQVKSPAIAWIINLAFSFGFSQGYLDEQFKQVQMLQDNNSPGFMADIVTLYCQDSDRILAEISQALYVFLQHHDVLRSVLSISGSF